MYYVTVTHSFLVYAYDLVTLYGCVLSASIYTINWTELNWTVRHCQSEEASILWSHHEETRELHGERNNARNNARGTQARKTTNGLDRQHQEVDRTLWKNQSEWQRIEINGESTAMAWPTLGLRTAKEQNRTDAFWPSWPFGSLKFPHFENTTWRRLPCWKIKKISMFQQPITAGVEVRDRLGVMIGDCLRLWLARPGGLPLGSATRF